jgi:hypothetical protein
MEIPWKMIQTRRFTATAHTRGSPQRGYDLVVTAECKTPDAAALVVQDAIPGYLSDCVKGNLNKRNQ